MNDTVNMWGIKSSIVMENMCLKPLHKVRSLGEVLDVKVSLVSCRLPSALRLWVLETLLETLNGSIGEKNEDIPIIGCHQINNRISVLWWRKGLVTTIIFLALTFFKLVILHDGMYNMYVCSFGVYKISFGSWIEGFDCKYVLQERWIKLWKWPTL